VSESLDTKSRSRRCHNVWHEPRSNWMRRESTGAHFTLKSAITGMTSVGRARFKSPLAHRLLSASVLGKTSMPSSLLANTSECVKYNPWSVVD
jgi:hypothetical protein